MNAMDVKAEYVLGLFRKGKDTVQIAKFLGLTEAKVSRLLWVARCRERNLPATFMNKAREVKRIAPAA